MYVCINVYEGVYIHVCDVSVCLCIYMCIYVYYGVYMSVCACVCNVYVLYACVCVWGGSRVRRIRISCRLLLSHSPPILTYLTLYTTWLGITAKIRQFLIALCYFAKICVGE